MRQLPLHTFHAARARELMEVHGWTVPAVFSDAEREYDACRAGKALVDVSLFGRIRITGNDALDLLHRLTTNDLAGMGEWTVRDTMFLSPRGRLVDLVSVLRTDDALELLVSPDREEALAAWIERYTIAEDLRIEITTDSGAVFFMPGIPPESFGGRLPAGNTAVRGPVPGAATSLRIHAQTPRWNGHLFIIPRDHAEAFWDRFAGELLTPAGWRAFDAYRIAHGIPGSGTEISDAFTPFDIRAMEAVSFGKGCYIGQEVVARIDTYNKVRRAPAGLLLSGPAQPDVLRLNGAEVGRLTSVSSVPIRGQYFGMGVVMNSITGESVETGEERVTVRIAAFPMTI